MTNFSIKQNDLLPELDAILQAANGSPVNLTNAVSIVFHMREEDGETMKITDGIVVINDNPATGQVSYAWVDTDTDTSGLFYCEFEVTWPGSKIQTFPSRGYVSVQILDDLA